MADWELDDISTLIKYYDPGKVPTAEPQVGQIVFTPVIYTDRRSNIFDIQRSDPYSHHSVTHTFRSLDDSVDFKSKPSRLPIKGLHLGETEELLASRAKCRPCLVLAKVDGLDVQSLPKGVQQNKALNSFNTIYCLAPIYSVTHNAKETLFGPVMTARIKCMMYPEFVYAPQSGMILSVPGVIRLDRTFWSHLIACTEPQNLFVSREILGICWTQIKLISGEQPPQDYTDLRDLLLEFLPEECK